MFNLSRMLPQDIGISCMCELSTMLFKMPVDPIVKESIAGLINVGG